ncbi:PaaI family thioesterase [Aquimarina pacifica]|uniref:PaaI family thioesterase n=1 Tax=Aquimarina pacifica TaxID=1296415 RepID=UPI00046F71EC|nr:hypothetical protein [Aquimarina pacifica]
MIDFEESFENMLDIESFRLPFGIGSGRTIVGDNSKLSLKFKANILEKKIIAKVTIPFHENLQGPPLHAHGGLSSYLLDEAMGTTVFAMGSPGGASKLSFSLHKMVPFDKELTIQSIIVNQTDNETQVNSMLLADNKILVKGTGIFKTIPINKLSLLFKISPHAKDEFFTYIQTFMNNNPDFQSNYFSSILHNFDSL